MLELDKFTCISRKDSNKDIFKQRKEINQNKRRNFNILLDVKDGKLMCMNETFSIESLCHMRFNSKCMLPGTNDLIDLMEE